MQRLGGRFGRLHEYWGERPHRRTKGGLNNSKKYATNYNTRVETVITSDDGCDGRETTGREPLEFYCSYRIVVHPHIPHAICT